MKTSDVGIKLIKFYESLHDGDLSKIGLQPKMCPSGIWTVGYGHVVKYLDGKFLKGQEDYPKLLEIHPNLESITEKEAEELLAEDLIYFENLVNRKLEVVVKQHQFDALVSHAYNTGGSTTLFQLINNDDTTDDELKDWFLTKYTTSNGVKLNGLVRRRLSEWILYYTGELKI